MPHHRQALFVSYHFMTSKALYLVLFFSLLGCKDATVTNVVSFNEPQPRGKHNLDKFPKHLQARYVSENKIYTLTIKDDYVFKTCKYEFKIPKDSLTDNSVTLIADTLYNNITKEKHKVILEGDTLIFKFDEDKIDTIFKISDKCVLRQFKGYYFLNKLSDDGSWDIQQLYLSKGILTINYVTDSNSIYKLKELTHSKNDTASFSLTKTQFKTFIKSGGFNKGINFYRLREPVKR